MRCVCIALALVPQVTYSTRGSFGEALRSHYNYLTQINSGAEASVWLPPPQPGKAPLETLGYR